MSVIFVLSENSLSVRLVSLGNSLTDTENEEFSCTEVHSTAFVGIIDFFDLEIVRRISPSARLLGILPSESKPAKGVSYTANANCVASGSWGVNRNIIILRLRKYQSHGGPATRRVSKPILTCIIAAYQWHSSSLRDRVGS